MKAILTIIALFILCSFVNAQGNCHGDNIKVYKGAIGCGCHCQKECVTPADLPMYLANGWNTAGCWNCCKFKNWVDADIKKTSLDSVYFNTDPGSLTVTFTLASQRDVKISVNDPSGKYIATVTDGYREDLDNEIIWNKNSLNPGIYFLTMDAGDYHKTKIISVTN